MLNKERRQKMMDGPGIYHGTAEVREDLNYIKKGTVGVVTAYLPDDNKFAVMWPGEKWITYDCTEEQFDEWFRLSSMDEVLISD